MGVTYIVFMLFVNFLAYLLSYQILLSYLIYFVHNIITSARVRQVGIGVGFALLPFSKQKQVMIALYCSIIWIKSRKKNSWAAYGFTRGIREIIRHVVLFPYYHTSGNLSITQAAILLISLILKVTLVFITPHDPNPHIDVIICINNHI